MHWKWFFRLSCLSLTKVMPQTLTRECFCFALGWNVTTDWRRVCHFVLCAGDWRGGLPSQITGCCPKSASTLPYRPRTENQGQQRTIECMLYSWCNVICYWYQPTLLSHRQWYSGFPVLIQYIRNCVYSMDMLQWKFWKIIYARECFFIH